MNRKGVSLVEFIIYFSIFAAVGVLLVNLLLITVRTRGTVQIRTEVQQNMRYSLQRIVQSIHNATAITSPLAGASGSSLNITVASVSTVFDVASSILRITEGAGSPQDITSDKVEVTSITFAHIANPSPAKPTIRITLAIKYKDGGNPQLKYSLTQMTTVALKQ